ncbi:T9SS type A sorting domain-containing protein [Winogradskyella pacifica]|uniref:T9SS type A sorting domain-containing protein n=1 Tax=Winogradskyella pacifica TaxID=664642 RepID=UPI0015CBDA24|nr:T9SS type A sorting domain-containing protein [Winogradskyella pacifica]
MKKQLFIRKKRQFRTLLKQIENFKEEGTWDDLASKTKTNLLNKLNRFYKVLKSHLTFSEWRRWVYPSFAMLGFLSMSNSLSAQTMNTFDTGVVLNADGAEISVMAQAYPTFADLDGDTDFELYLGQLGDPLLVQNFGAFNQSTMEFGAPTDLVTAPISGFVFEYSAPTFADFDADGDLDLLVGIYTGEVQLFLNDGSDAFTIDSTVLANGTSLSVTGEARPTVVDFDADGDLDLVIGFNAGGLMFFENTAGAGNAMVFNSGVAVQANSANISTGTFTSPVFGDLDEDGDLDLIVGSQPGLIEFFENTAGAGSPMIFNASTNIQVDGADLDIGILSTIAVVDLDKDGTEDLVVGNAAGKLTFFKGNSSNLSVSDFDSQELLQVFPNPVKDVFTIETSIEISRVALFDISGKQIDIQIANTNEVDISSLASGIYHIKIYDNNNRTTTRKIIKK